MATADPAVAMGRGGSELAVETADVILVRDETATIPTSITLGCRQGRSQRDGGIQAVALPQTLSQSMPRPLRPTTRWNPAACDAERQPQAPRKSHVTSPMTTQAATTMLAFTTRDARGRR